ncbi:hypothetical protein [Parapedobacter indicus]|uniref:DUF2383 domain-containing protein n=1 Tax=Parapedobacter indicus TaxID=1477437 RepID=A0A1I3US95_9SPHI|nr:hypothetical protein [Parapedobacter indicus]PPK99113.1 hypothetical protein CLV26_115146 [Parapedobacter indicus]SFJ85633.1 hypothetical protein SAMN05444682_11532 [Parapedobacter indicus]
MENLKTTTECLQDLVAFHSERINGYQALLNRLTADEHHLTTLFEAFIKQSIKMKLELLDMGVQCGLEETQLTASGQFGLAWSVVKAVFSSRMPSYALDKCRSGENALLIAYHSVEGTDGLQPSLRALVNQQKREVIAARDWISHFERFCSHSVRQQLAAVS